MTAATAEPAKPHETDLPVHERPSTARSGRPRAAPARLGPLLAVCGLAGGVGVTTLAYLIALAAARQWPDPVLVADTGGPSGGLAACAGVEVPRSLGELAEQLAAGAPLGAGIYAHRTRRVASPRRRARVLIALPRQRAPRARSPTRARPTV